MLFNKKIKLSWLIRFIVFLFFLEILSYFPNLYWGDQYFPPLSLYKHVEKPKVRPTTIHGAVGEDLENKPFRILALGDSILEGKGVNYSDHWLYLLKQEYQHITVDNFAIGWTIPGAMEIKLKQLLKKQIRYDLVIVQTNFRKSFNSKAFKYHHFSYRWQPDCDHGVNSICLLKKWMDRKIKNENLILNTSFFKKILGFSKRKKNKEQAKGRQEKENLKQAIEKGSVWSQRFRNSLFVKSRLTDQPQPIFKKRYDRINEYVDRLIKLSNKISRNTIWMPSRSFYYSKNNKQEKLRGFVVLSKQEKEPTFLSARGLSRLFDQFNSIAYKRIQERHKKVFVFDYMKEIHSTNSEKQVLFFDDLHLNVNGHKKVFELVSKNFSFLLSKNQNK